MNHKQMQTVFQILNPNRKPLSILNPQRLLSGNADYIFRYVVIEELHRTCQALAVQLVFGC
jgi:hypothetical protein